MCRVGYVTCSSVTVAVSGGVITAVEAGDNSETQGISSKAIFTAVEEALSQAV